MNQNFLLALDGGTGSFRAVLFDLKGQQVAIEQIPWTHLPDPNYEDSIDFDCKNNWNIILQCIKNLFTNTNIQGKQIIGISTTSMREGFVVYGPNNIELMAFSNVDARSKQEAIALKKKFPDLEKEVYQISGQSFALSAIPRLLWLKKNKPELYDKMENITMLNDWISFKLTNTLTVEPSNACTTGIFSLEERAWSTNIADKLNLKSDIFPPVIESGNIIGGVTSEVAKITGLFEGTPVVAGGGDAQLGGIGVGAIDPGQIALFGGSFWQYEYNSHSFKNNSLHYPRINCHAVPGIWQFESIAWNPGQVMKWFVESFCQEEKLFAQEHNLAVYDVLDKRSKDVPPGSNGMYALFSNQMNFLNLKHCAPSFINFALDSSKFNKYTFYNAIMESPGFVTYSHLKQIYDITKEEPLEIIFAGGASQNKKWCQIICDILGVPLKTPKVKEATALGAALLAGVGVGIYQDLEETKELIQWDNTYYPKEENHFMYKKMHENFLEIYEQQLSLSDRHLTTHMWIAPGVN